MKLHLACGEDHREGYVNVDVRETKATDVIQDLQRMPWPWANGEVEEIQCKDYLPCLSSQKRIAFLNEAYRVLKPQGTMVLIVPGRHANRSMADPSFVWPPVVEDWFYWSNKEWREQTGNRHYPFTCDFHWSYGFGLDDEWAPRSEESQRYAIKFHTNAAHSMIVTLVALKPDAEV